MGVSEAQKRATQKYNEKNKDKRRYLSLKSSSKTFINKYANKEDLIILQDILNSKLKDFTPIENNKKLELTKSQLTRFKNIEDLLKDTNLDINNVSDNVELEKEYCKKYNCSPSTVKRHFKEYINNIL